MKGEDIFNKLSLSPFYLSANFSHEQVPRIKNGAETHFKIIFGGGWGDFFFFDFGFSLPLLEGPRLEVR
jgi:hypothetical protein